MVRTTPSGYRCGNAFDDSIVYSTPLTAVIDDRQVRAAILAPIANPTTNDLAVVLTTGGIRYLVYSSDGWFDDHTGEWLSDALAFMGTALSVTALELSDDGLIDLAVGTATELVLLLNVGNTMELSQFILVPSPIVAICAIGTPHEGNIV
jgi:hypothetical protein